MRRITGKFLSIICIGIVFFGSCKKDNDNPSTPAYTVPVTYNFSNADSLTAKTILSMLAQMESQISAANTGNEVSSATLKSMFINQGNFFRDTTFGGATLNLNSSAFQLQNLTISPAISDLNNLFDSVEAGSETHSVAANGVAGVSSRNTLLSANGVYWRQKFTKTMMGVLIGHLITDVYLGDSLNTATTIEAKQHAWDNAFFLWCVPVDFPTNRTAVKYWGSYTSQIDSGIIKPVANLTGINANPTLLNAFLTGRAALANNDLNMALQQANIIIPFFEIMEAAAALHETNEAKGNLSNGPAAVCGNLSESIGFWIALKYNQHKKISDADYNSVLALYGTNFYNITPEGIQAIQDRISSIYGWDAVKLNL